MKELKIFMVSPFLRDGVKGGMRGTMGRQNRKPAKSIAGEMKGIFILMSILVLLLCVFTSRSIRQLLINRNSEYTEITAQKLCNELEFLYEKMDTFSMSISQDEAVQGLLTASFSQKTGFINSVQEMRTYYIILDPRIIDIAIVNDEVHYSLVYSAEELDMLSDECADKLYTWLGVRKSGYYILQNNPPMLVYARDVRQNGEKIGKVIISIDVGELPYTQADDTNAYYFLADENGVIYPFNCGRELSDEIWSFWKEEPLKWQEKRQAGKSWYLSGTPLENMECYLISAFDIRQVNRSLQPIQMMIWGSVIFSVLFFLLSFGMIQVQVVNPLKNFHGIIQKIRFAGQKKHTEQFELGGCLEMQEIGEEFNGMLSDIDTLNRKIFDTITDLYETKVQKQQAELSYMRSQIDPHFLYNTLEVFRKMALEKDAPEAAQIAVDMGNIFRYSIKGDAVVPLADEIKIVRSYISIQEKRFQGKIKVFYMIPENLLQIPVMKMLLQPIVENAFYHGLEPKEEKGNLLLGVRQEGDFLVLMVKDDGVGIPAQKLEEIRNLLAAEHYDTSRHVGILNTQARIRLGYGKKYGLTVESREGDGTTVTVYLPAEPLEMGDKNEYL